MRDRTSRTAEPFRTLFTLGVTGEMSDGDLLGRYLDGRADQAECAFATLVDRHGAMVRHVCLAVLGDPHDAADAFQATFLVLAKRAGSIRRAESVGPWLFGVARRVSKRARVAAARRRQVERSKAERDADRLVVLDPDGHRPEDWAPLYEELDRLPARYRDALVLCDLEGLSHDLAAARLGCPIATLRTRLTRGRRRLRARLTRLGLAPTSTTAVLFSSAVAPPARLAVPTAWASAAARLSIAARGASAASLAVPLAASTLRTMTMIALTRSIALGGVTVFGLGAGVAGLTAFGNAGAVPAPDAPPTSTTTASLPTESAQEGPEPAPTAPAPPDGHARPGDGAINARSEIEGQTTIIMALPEGTKVRKDQLVCELDPALIEDQLNNQQIATEHANSDYMNGIKLREIAETEVVHYIKGVYPMEEAAAQGEVELARAELKLAQAYLDREERLLARIRGDGPLSAVTSKEEKETRELEAKSAQVEVLRAELALKKAEKALEVLREYTFELQIKTLEGAVERAIADELFKKSLFDREKNSEAKLRRMIEKCKIFAPVSGVIRYPEGVEEGATVRERQLLFWIEPLPDGEAESGPSDDPK